MVPKSVPEALAAASARHPQRTAVQHRGRRIAYARLQSQVDRAARALHELGVRRGHRVAIVCDLHPESVVALHAVMRIGAVAVLQDPRASARDLADAFADHRAVVAVVDRAAVPRLRALPEAVAPKALVGVDPGRSRRRTLATAARHPWRPLVRAALALARARRRARSRIALRRASAMNLKTLLGGQPLSSAHPLPDPSDLAMIHYGARGTDSPLGAMLSHGNLVAASRQLREQWVDHMVQRGATVCITAPLHEAPSSPFGVVAPLLGSMRLVLADSPAEVVGTVARCPVDLLCTTSRAMDGILRVAEQTGTDLRPIRRVLVADLGLTPELASRWVEATGGEIATGYVRAECGVALGGAFDAERPDALGMPLPQVRIRVDADGTLAIAGPQVFHGYWNRPDETAHSLSGDGWLRTGEQVAPFEDDGEGGTDGVDGVSAPRLRAVAGRTIGHGSIPRHPSG
ncbi:MAG: AMP-binding protein [Brachybacterium sp.]|nr:AMP-binding protein [Brachybacterium sp.]